jgi:hypothetical protein
MYYRLATREEKDVMEKCPEKYKKYKKKVPMFFPKIILKKKLSSRILSGTNVRQEI